VIWFAPGEKHWHGAMPTTAMTHIAIQEKLDGKVVDWMERSATNNIRISKNLGTDGTFPDFLSCGSTRSREGGDCGIPPLRLRSGQALAQKAAQGWGTLLGVSIDQFLKFLCGCTFSLDSHVT
jgi:hypothetical protein